MTAVNAIELSGFIWEGEFIVGEGPQWGDKVDLSLD